MESKLLECYIDIFASCEVHHFWIYGGAKCVDTRTHNCIGKNKRRNTPKEEIESSFVKHIRIVSTREEVNTRKIRPHAVRGILQHKKKLLGLF